MAPRTPPRRATTPAKAPTLDVARVRAAFARRAEHALPAVTDVVRLIDGEGDGAPGVVLDRFGDVARLEVWAADWPAFVGDDAFVAALRGALDALGVCAAVRLLRTAAGRSSLLPWWGRVNESHVVVEDGVRLLVRVADERAAGTGVFVDQRAGRRLVRDRARGRVVVNLFAHAGAYGAAAAVGGAARVDHVDMAKKCAPWAAANLALNGIDPRGHRFIVDDALLVLKKLSRRSGERPGIIVCDPPTQAVRHDGSRFVLSESLTELAHDACAALGDDGTLVLSCNDRDVPVERVLAAAAEGARAAGRTVASLGELPLPPDITSAKAERGRPMRGAVLVVR